MAEITIKGVWMFAALNYKAIRAENDFLLARQRKPKFLR